MSKSQSGTNRNLSTNDTISTIEPLSEHMHGSALSVGNTFTATKEFSNDRLDGSSTHQSKAVTAVGGDDIVFLGERVFDTDSDGFLPCGKMAETTNLLLLVQSIGGHFHTSTRSASFD